MTTREKIAEMQSALITIKRLMPEVEAEISQMGGVGAAPGNTSDLQREIRKSFYKTHKVKNNFKK